MEEARFLGSTRFGIALLLHLAQAVNYANRTCLSTAIDGSSGMAAAYGWDDGTKGLVLSSFFWSYASCQLGMGAVILRFGPRRVLITAFTVQGALALCFPLVVQQGLVFPVLIVRFLIGCMQAALTPCMVHTIAAWVPAFESSRAYAISDCGNSVGASVAFVLTPQLMNWSSWPAPFYFMGVASLLWACIAGHSLWDSPVEHPRIRSHEVAWLAHHLAYSHKVCGAATARSHSRDGRSEGLLQETGMAASESAASSSWTIPTKMTRLRSLLCRASVLCLPFVFFAGSWGWYVFLTFLPQYLHNQLNFDLRASGGVAILPYVTHLLGQNLAALVADRMLSARSLRPTVVRRLFHSGGSLGAAAALVGVIYAPDVASAVGLLALSNLFYGFTSSGAWVAPMQISPPYAGLLEGFANGSGNGAGIRRAACDRLAASVGWLPR